MIYKVELKKYIDIFSYLVFCDVYVILNYFICNWKNIVFYIIFWLIGVIYDKLWISK